MAKLSLKGKDLRKIGYKDDKVISRAIQVMHGYYKHSSMEEALLVLKKVLHQPDDYATDAVLGRFAAEMVAHKQPEILPQPLNNKRIPYTTFGESYIEPEAMHQMSVAMKLPVSVAGALMPDAHHGYGLPIGGVLATSEAVIPYAVGVDIGCRMCLTIFKEDGSSTIKRQHKHLTNALKNNTLFGSGSVFVKPTDHEVLHRKEFGELAILRGLQKKAAQQIGSSGSGNHFVEFGVVTISEPNGNLGLVPGDYLGLLSHSGSRGLGAGIANYYTRLAMNLCRLPGEAKNLAWLDMNKQEGIEYWLAMSLAGDYAAACHHIIHKKLTKELGLTPQTRIENHHNFAWKEVWEGREVIVHRKGATPAAKGIAGIIPGSMTDPGFIVTGKGEPSSLYSASHGAGRRFSRAKAKASISHKALKDLLDKNEVTLLGGGLDEAPLAYKNIHEVMKQQRQLIDVAGMFQPRIVIMD